MLYDDKRWDKQTKADPLTLESFVAWLEKHNPKKRYNFDNCSGGCLYGQYMAAMGVPWLQAGGQSDSTPIGAFETRIYGIASPSPQTFGAALARARKLADAS